MLYVKTLHSWFCFSYKKRVLTNSHDKKNHIFNQKWKTANNVTVCNLNFTKNSLVEHKLTKKIKTRLNICGENQKVSSTNKKSMLFFSGEQLKFYRGSLFYLEHIRAEFDVFWILLVKSNAFADHNTLCTPDLQVHFDTYLFVKEDVVRVEVPVDDGLRQ